MEPEKEIRIENLTQYQVDLLDIMWAIDDESEFFEWYHNLDREDQVMADDLMRLLVMEMREDDIEDLSEAQAVLKKFML